VLWHNCAAKPVSAAKTDFMDGSLLLILRNLLKAKDGPEIPAYMARPPFFNNLRTVLATQAVIEGPRPAYESFYRHLILAVPRQFGAKPAPHLVSKTF
jgi:hypothetical protein